MVDVTAEDARAAVTAVAATRGEGYLARERRVPPGREGADEIATVIVIGTLGAPYVPTSPRFPTTYRRPTSIPRCVATC